MTNTKVYWSKGTYLRCINARFGITNGKLYTLLENYVASGSRLDCVFIVDDECNRMYYFANRFQKVNDNKEFTDEEYESLLV